MAMGMMLDQLESRADGIAQAFRTIALHRQPAAFLRTIGGEGRNDGIAARLHATVQALDIGGAVPSLNQKMKRGPVVPDIEGARRLPRGDVRRDPLRFAGCRTNPQLRRLKCRLRQIENRDFIEAILLKYTTGEMPPPWVIDPTKIGSSWGQGSHADWIQSAWRPYWCQLDLESKQSYMDRWNGPEFYREVYLDPRFC